MKTDNAFIPEYDVVLIGAGIMSATLGVFLKELQPDWSIRIFERADRVASESSDAWNNAGTGHSGLCELNYAPQAADGTVDVSKAEKIAEMFEVSKQFWAYLVDRGNFGAPDNFINSCPHMSMVWGEDNVAYLGKRFEAMSNSHLFEGICYSTDPGQLAEWVPLIMTDRDPRQPIAASRIEIGTDVNFGALTRKLFALLCAENNVTLSLHSEVHHLHQESQDWVLEIADRQQGTEEKVRAKFVFIGAGGGSLPLLEKSKIKEGKGYAGFPVSGQWLRCTNEKIIALHHAKVYGKAGTGTPPMSVPHLDTRVIDGKKELLFGPFAGFSTKFLKDGSLLDLPRSIHFDNILSLLGAGAHNIALTEYLVKQVMQSPEDRLQALKEFFPDAKMEDWVLSVAGQRVQVIRRDAREGGILEFGTEVITHSDGSIAALLGASPGASTSVSIMIELMQQCFPEKMASAAWQKRLQEMIPTYGQTLGHDAELCRYTRRRTHQILGLRAPATV